MQIQYYLSTAMWSLWLRHWSCRYIFNWSCASSSHS